MTCVDDIIGNHNVTEDVTLDTAGGIRNAAGALRGAGSADPVVVFNSDIPSGDLAAQVASVWWSRVLDCHQLVLG